MTDAREIITTAVNPHIAVISHDEAEVMAQSCANSVIAALSSAGYAIEPDWRPIDETAKRAGRILVFRESARPENQVGIDYWSSVGWYRSRPDEQPTYWKPRPVPPNNRTKS